MRTAFQQEAEDVTLGENRENGRKTEAAGVSRDRSNLGAARFEGSDFFLRCGASAKDEEVVLHGEDELRGQGRAEVSIEDNAKQWPSSYLSSLASIGEERVVGEDGANAGEDCIRGVAKHVDFCACGGSGEPVRLVREAASRWRSQFAVDRQRGLERDEGSAGTDEMGEGFVEVAGLLLQDTGGNLDACSLKFGDASTAYQRVRIDSGDDTTGDTCCDKSISARACATMMAAGFEGDVGGSAFSGESAFCCLFQRDDLCVVTLVVDVGAFGEGLVVADENAADLRIW